MVARSVTVLAALITALIFVFPASADSTLVVEPDHGPPGSTFSLVVDSNLACGPGSDPALEVYFAPKGLEVITRDALIKLRVESLEPEGESGPPTATVLVPDVDAATYGVYWRCPTTGATTEGGSQIWGVDESTGTPGPGPLAFRVTTKPPDTSTVPSTSTPAGLPPLWSFLLVATSAATLLILRQRGAR